MDTKPGGREGKERKESGRKRSSGIFFFSHLAVLPVQPFSGRHLVIFPPNDTEEFGLGLPVT